MRKFIQVVATVLCFVVITQISLPWGGEAYAFSTSSLSPSNSSYEKQGGRDSKEITDYTAITVTDSTYGESADSRTAIKIDFLSPEAEQTGGYLPDYGYVFAEQGGLKYGWGAEHTAVTVVSSTYGRPLENSFIRMKAEANWEIEIPNGSYDLKIAVGDQELDSINTLYAEDTVILDHVKVPMAESRIAAGKVIVRDGRLTLHHDDYSNTTALQYLEIRPSGASEKVTREMKPPYIGLPAEQNKVPGDQIILSGTQNNEHNAVPSILVPGLSKEIRRYLNERLNELEQAWEPYEQQAVSCSGSAEAIATAIDGSFEPVAAIHTGQLNLDNSVTFGSPSRPVFLITNGLNINRAVTITVYGTLIVRGDLNANQGGRIIVQSADDSDAAVKADLRVEGTIHLNQNSVLKVADELVTDNLIYNSGQLDISAKSLIVENSLHINTKVDMNITEEMIVGNLISNNDKARIIVGQGDLFITNDVHVNNQLDVHTGGVWAIGGSITSNQKPVVSSGDVHEGQTKLKYIPYGLKAEYFVEEDLRGKKITLLDANVNLNGKLPVSSPDLNDGGLSIRWTGMIEAYTTEEYTFSTEANGGVRLWVNGKLLIDAWDKSGGNDRQKGTVSLEAGRLYDIQMEFATDRNQPKAVLSWSSGMVQEEVVPQAQLTPFAVPELSAVPSDRDIALVWTDAFNAEGYEVEIDGEIKRLDVQNQYVHEPLNSGTKHTYRVRASAGALHGNWSKVTELWTLPGIPANIRLDATSEQIRLQWDEVIGAVSYEVEANGDIVSTNNLTTYIEKDLNPNVQRAFRVRAVNSSGAGKWSEVLAKTTLPGSSRVLQTKAKDISIQVSWDAVSGAEGYELEVDGHSIQVTGTQYLHQGLEPNTEHTYRIRSGNAQGYGPWSDLVRAVTLPSIPQNFQAEPQSQGIVVAWDRVPGATGYDIEVDGVIHDTGADNGFIHQGLPPDTDHNYRVRARSGEVFGEWSDILMRTTLADFPVNLQATATDSAITLTWDPVIGAKGYDVEVDGTVISNGLELIFVHPNLLPFTEHEYRVRARSEGGIGPWSDKVTAVTALGVPSNIRFETTTDTITVRWDPVAGATGYDLIVDGEMVDVGDTLQYIHSGLAPSSWHVYRVRAKNGDLAGTWSSAFTKSAALGIPVIKEAKSYTSKILLSWDEVIGATGYDIEINGEVKDNREAVSYLHQNLPPGAQYTFRVRAKNEAETSEWSKPVSFATTSEVIEFISATATTDSIALEWTAGKGSEGYDLEIDGSIVPNIMATSYTHKGLEANTIHIYRVRVHSSEQENEWSAALEKKTVSEIIVNVGKDNFFNLVVVAPQKAGASERTVVVTYEPDEVEMIDLSAVTPDIELTTGVIEKAGMTIERFNPGEIVIRVHDPGKTFVNGIRFVAKTNNPSSITYIVE